MSPTATPIAAPCPILVDRVSTASDNSSTLTWTHTVSGSTLLLVGVSLRGNDTVTNVTYGNLTLTRVGAQYAGYDWTRVELWSLLNPPVGSAAVLVELDGNARVAGGAVSFFGIDPVTPYGAFNSELDQYPAQGNPSGPPPSITLPSALGEVVFDLTAVASDGAPVFPGFLQFPLWNVEEGNGSSGIVGTASMKAGTSSTTTSWSVAKPTLWAIAAISLRPAACSLALTGATAPAVQAQNHADYAPPQSGAPALRGHLESLLVRVSGWLGIRQTGEPPQSVAPPPPASRIDGLRSRLREVLPLGPVRMAPTAVPTATRPPDTTR